VGVQGGEVRERRDLRDKLSGFPRTLPNVIGNEIRWVRGAEEKMKGGLRKEVTLGTSVVVCSTNAIFVSLEALAVARTELVECSSIGSWSPFSESAYFLIVMKLNFFFWIQNNQEKNAKLFLNSRISELSSKTWLLNSGISELFSKTWLRIKAIPIGFLKRVW
jgi:hypothetical protein